MWWAILDLPSVPIALRGDCALRAGSSLNRAQRARFALLAVAPFLTFKSSLAHLGEVGGGGNGSGPAKVGGAGCV